MNVKENAPAAHLLSCPPDVTMVEVVGRHRTHVGLGRLLNFAVDVQFGPEKKPLGKLSLKQQREHDEKYVANLEMPVTQKEASVLLSLENASGWYLSHKCICTTNDYTNWVSQCSFTSS